MINTKCLPINSKHQLTKTILILCGFAARCAERLCLSDRLSLILRLRLTFAHGSRRSLSPEFLLNRVRRGEAIAAHRAAKPQKQVFLTCLKRDLPKFNLLHDRIMHTPSIKFNALLADVPKWHLSLMCLQIQAHLNLSAHTKNYHFANQ